VDSITPVPGPRSVALWGVRGEGGDPVKLAAAIVDLAGRDEAPARFPGGADAVTTFEDRAKLLLELADANRELSSHLDHHELRST
jgi:hypothetical protein